MLKVKAMLAGVLACVLACSSLPEPSPPSREDLERVCPAALLVATVECPARAAAACRGYETFAACPKAEAVRAQCRYRIREEFKKCL